GALVPFQVLPVHRTTPHPIGGNLAAWRQGNEAALVQLEQERARRHVLQLPRSVAPIPVRRQRLRQTSATPPRILPQPLTEPLQVQFPHRPALHHATFAHGRESKPGKNRSPVQNEKSSHPVPGPPGSA